MLGGRLQTEILAENHLKRMILRSEWPHQQLLRHQLPVRILQSNIAFLVRQRRRECATVKTKTLYIGTSTRKFGKLLGAYYRPLYDGLDGFVDLRGKLLTARLTLTVYFCKAVRIYRNRLAGSRHRVSFTFSYRVKYISENKQFVDNKSLKENKTYYLAAPGILAYLVWQVPRMTSRFRKVNHQQNLRKFGEI